MTTNFTMHWIDIHTEKPPQNKPFDICIQYINSLSNVCSRRVCNCWFDGIYILSGDTNLPVYGAMYWMLVEIPHE